MTCAEAQVNVTTQQYDIGRTGQNLNETNLTPANVNTATFGMLFSRSVDGLVYAQPLYLSNLAINGATHNVAFIATEHDSVYAFDADDNGGANASPLWMASMLSPEHGAAAGATTVPWPPGSTIDPEVGITGTPVIDPASGTLYVVSKDVEGGAQVQRLHALDVTTGAEKFGGPVAIAASVSGTAADGVGGTLSFNSKQENQRPGLLLLNGIVYIGWTAHEDLPPWHGWIIGYNAGTLRQTGVFCTTPNGSGGGIWMSGNGLAADQLDPVNQPYGRMFVATGNGDYTATQPYSNQMDYGDTHLNLDLSNGVLTVSDEFTTRMQASDNTNDNDVGSGGVMVLPTQTAGSFPHLLVQSDKVTTTYLLNRDNLGGYNASTDQAVQELTAAVGSLGVWSSPAYWNGTIYYWGETDHLKAFPLINGLLSTSTPQSTEVYGFPGATPAISANGTADAIVWSINSSEYGSAAAILQAHDAGNVSATLYSSDSNAARDRAGIAVKFSVPTVANGKVYVGASKEVDVYGLLPPVAATPTFTPAAGTYTSAQTVTISDATSGAKIYYTTNGTTPTTASTLYSAPVSVSVTQTLQAIATASGYTTSSVGAAAYTINVPAATPTFTPAAGTYTSAQTVTISDATSGAKIYYTNNGTTPTTASTLYSAPVSVSVTETLKAMATATGHTNSGVGTAAYTINSGTPVINDPTGFTSSTGLSLVGGATLTGNTLQLTTATGGVQARAAWYTTPVNVQSFTTDFNFQITSPVGNGITFTLQNAAAGVNAIGTAGGGLGYQGIGSSVAVKFDLVNNAGEGPNSTGFYTNGAAPTVPAVDLTPSGINLHSGDTMHAHITYNGTTLTLTLTDIVTNASFTNSTTINIPATVGANTAYVGFTAATGWSTATQSILNWTYLVGSTTPVAATPTFTPAAGTYTSAQTVTISDATSGAKIYYTTNGTTPTTASTLYSAPVSVSVTETLKAMATATGHTNSGVGTAAYTINSGTPVINDPTGFTSSTGLSLVGGATLTGNTLQLTTATGGVQARAVWYATPVNVQSFTTDFNFQITSPVGNGITFALQNAAAGVNAIGMAGGGLGYQGIGSSVAVKFDLVNNAGEGPNSTGFYTNGAAPTVPAIDLTPSGINLHSGDTMHAHITYNGTTLTLTLTDTVTNASFTTSMAINIPATVGANTAYVGFTAATGWSTATQSILNWTYLAGSTTTPVAATPTFTPAAGTYTSAQTITIGDATSGAKIYYTTNGTTPTTSSTLYSGPVTVSATETLAAIATASGYSTSSVGMAAYTINTGTAPVINDPNGFSSSTGLSFVGGATLTNSTLQLTTATGGVQSKAVWYATPVNVQSFTTDFNFQITSPVGNGITFALQNAAAGVNAIGMAGGGLGYQGIGSSVAVKFDLVNNAGEGPNSTGFYTNGAAPTVPAIDLTPSGINLHSGDTMHAHITYNGTTLTLTLTDTVTNASFTTSMAINIPATVGANTAYVGFTAATGWSTATQSILNWTYAVN